MEQTSTDDRLHRFTQLWMSSHRAVAAFISMSVHDLHHAEDVLQEVASDASKNFDRYDPERPFIAWLIGIARQRIADYYRRESRQPLMISTEATRSLADAYVELSDEVDDRVIALRKCMQHLPRRHAKLLDQRYGWGLSLSEIAAKIGSTERAVNSLFSRIRKALLNCVEQRLEAQQ